ncbi:MAG: ABC transporter substrate-binding protein [Alphaproteobacteria bacterium]|nr:ABC transporter substrate-binding protein [Alphaproteobacteria bacterium]
MTRTEVSKRLRRGVAAIAAGAMLAAGLLGGAAALDSAAAGEAKQGGTLIFALPEEPLSMTGFTISDNGSIWAIEQVCDSLLEPDDSGYGLRPALAESWDVSDDQMVYTLHIRDAKFSNGDPVTMADIQFSLDKATDPEGYLGFVFPAMTREVVDGKTLKITLEQPFTPLLSTLSLFAAGIVHKATYEASPEDFGVQPVCAGPFKVESFQRGNKLVLVPNEHYWDAQPHVDKIEMRYVPESNARILGLKSGDFDVINVVPLNQAKSIEADPGLTLEVSPAFRLDYVYLNHARAPLDNKDIRMALNYAANRDAILKAVFFGYGKVPNSYMPVINYHCDSVEKIAYDPEKAKALVAGAGYDGTTIELIAPSGDSATRQSAQILQQGWRAAGLNVEIVEFDIGTAFGMMEEGNFNAFVSYITSDTNDQDFLASIEADNTIFGGFFSSYNNKQVTDWLTEARQSGDPAVRQDLYCKVQQQVYWDGYSVPLNFKPFVNAYRNDVIGFHNSVTGPWWLKDVWLDR